MTSAYIQLFEESHNENLLREVKEVDSSLLSKIRGQGIKILCLPDFTPAHVAILNGSRSSTAVLTDGILPANTIIVNNSQVVFLAKRCDIGLPLARALALAHEWKHLELMKCEGLDEAQSEVRVWSEVAKLNLCSPDDFENFRNLAFLAKDPNFSKRKLDTRPEFLKFFNKFSSKLGYSAAWQASLALARRDGLSDWKIQELLQENGWDFNVCCDLFDGSAETGLLRHAVLKSDYSELNRLVEIAKTRKPVPEQPPIA